MADHPLIHLREVHKVYVTEEIETHVLSSVDLQIERGEYVSISGPSGCGKSTLLSILGLLDAPTRGAYFLDGVPLHELAPLETARIRNRNVGFIFQNFNLIGDMTVADNIALPLLYRGVPMAERKVAVSEALARVNMSHRAKHYPS